MAVIFLLGYLAAILVAVWGVERFIEGVTRPRGIAHRCGHCGITLMPHEGPNDYGGGPVWECDTCLGISS